MHLAMLNCPECRKLGTTGIRPWQTDNGFAAAISILCDNCGNFGILYLKDAADILEEIDVYRKEEFKA